MLCCVERLSTVLCSFLQLCVAFRAFRTLLGIVLLCVVLLDFLGSFVRCRFPAGEVLFVDIGAYLFAAPSPTPSLPSPPCEATPSTTQPFTTTTIGSFLNIKLLLQKVAHASHQEETSPISPHPNWHRLHFSPPAPSLLLLLLSLSTTPRSITQSTTHNLYATSGLIASYLTRILTRFFGPSTSRSLGRNN